MKDDRLPSRRCLPLCTMLALTLAVVCLPASRPAFAQFVPGVRQAEIHNPYSRRYVDMRAGGIFRRGSYSSITAFIGGGSPWGGYGRFSYGFGVPYRNQFEYSFNYGSPYWSGGWGNSSLSVNVAPLAPVVVPGEQLFGPKPLRNMLGGAPPLGPLTPIEIELPDQPMPPVASNAEAREKAQTWIGFGDRHFGLQDYRDAYQRYKKASEAAPDLVEPYLLQGQAMLAIGNYELATRAFKRALTMHPDWARATFDLNEIYARHPAAKTAHMESLAAAAERDPASGDLMLLVGVQLFYDGQAERSLPFFRRAKELSQEEIPLPEIVAPGKVIPENVQPQQDARLPQAF